MKQKIVSLCVATLMAIAQGYSGVTLTVPEVNIGQGGTSYVIINYDLGTTAYTAYQFEIAYPEGISSVNDSDGNPSFIKGEVYNDNHSVSSSVTTEGKSLFQCYSGNSDPFTAQSGTLLMLPIKAQKTLAVGTYQATISPIEFVQTDATPDRPEAITFNITVSSTVVLDELSTIAPTAASGVNVTVLRTINANEWSTICLPFAMTAEQIQTAFGEDVTVELAHFTGYTCNGTTIIVNFDNVTSIEANHPYLIKVSTSISQFHVNNVTINPSSDPRVSYKTNNKRLKDFVGTFVAEFDFYNDATHTPLFLSGNKFWYATENTNKMKAFRGYFDFYDEVSDASSRITMHFEGDATGIRDLNHETIINNRYYDLQGRRVENPAKKGLYIRNGKKMTVK